MAIRVYDHEGEAHVFEDDGTATFETEGVSNNLTVTTGTIFAVFAADKWCRVEQDNPFLAEEVDDDANENQA